MASTSHGHACCASILPSVARSVAVEAFTLIELLVVIAIIAILASIAFPVVGGMLSKGDSVKCVNNLRQIGGAISLYTTDNNGFLPYSSGPSYEGKGISHPFSGWQAPLAYYLNIGQLSPGTLYKTQASYDDPKAKHAFNCPSCKTMFRTYTANKHAMGFLPSGETSPYPRRKAISFARPSQLVLIADSETVDGKISKNTQQFDQSTYLTIIGTRHNGKANALFADYHVESVDGPKLEPAINIRHK